MLAIVLIIVVACFIILLFLAFMWYRNNWVHKTRMKIAREDIREYAELIDYNSMLWKFWVFDIEKLKKEK